MPRLTGSTPKYRHHRASGQAIVTLSGVDNYLGPHGSRTSKREYDRLVGEWLAAGRNLPASEEQGYITVTELAARYWKFASVYYQRNGEPTGSRAGAGRAAAVWRWA